MKGHLPKLPLTLFHLGFHWRNSIIRNTINIYWTGESTSICCTRSVFLDIFFPPASSPCSVRIVFMLVLLSHSPCVSKCKTCLLWDRERGCHFAVPRDASWHKDKAHTKDDRHHSLLFQTTNCGNDNTLWTGLEHGGRMHIGFKKLKCSRPWCGRGAALAESGPAWHSCFRKATSVHGVRYYSLVAEPIKWPSVDGLLIYRHFNSTAHHYLINVNKLGRVTLL